MNINLAEFLKEYGADIPESVRCGEVFKLTHSEKLDSVSFFAHFTEIVPTDDIFAFETAVEKALKIDRVRLCCRYTPEMFGTGCFGELIKMLRRDISAVNGFLDDAEISLNGGQLDIKVVHGGTDMLNKANFCGELSKLIYNMFGVSVKTVLNGENSVSVSEYDKMVERLAAELPDISAQLIPPKSAEEMAEEARKAAIPTATVDIGSLDKEFDKESAEIIKGKAIREAPVSINEAVQRLGEKLVVVGDVFAVEIKELRNE